jgi:hypothetical protein
MTKSVEINSNSGVLLYFVQESRIEILGSRLTAQSSWYSLEKIKC